MVNEEDGSIIKQESVESLQGNIYLLNKYFGENATIEFDDDKIRNYGYLSSHISDIIDKSRIDHQLNALSESYEKALQNFDSIKREYETALDENLALYGNYMEKSGKHEMAKLFYEKNTDFGPEEDLYVLAAEEKEAEDAFSDSVIKISALNELLNSYESIINEYKGLLKEEKKYDIEGIIKSNEEEISQSNEWRAIQEKEKHKYVVKPDIEETAKHIDDESQKATEISQNKPSIDETKPNAPPTDTYDININTQPMTDSVNAAFEEIAASAGEYGTESADNFADDFKEEFELHTEEFIELFQKTIASVQAGTALRSSIAYDAPVNNSYYENTVSGNSRYDIDRLIEGINKPIYITLDGNVIGETAMKFSEQQRRITRK